MKVGIIKLSAQCYDRFWSVCGSLFIPLKVEYNVARSLYIIECKSELFTDQEGEGYEILVYTPVFRCINGVEIFVGFED